jgi:hypothetical protein
VFMIRSKTDGRSSKTSSFLKRKKVIP